jgi:hypothetical protein
MDDFFSFDDAAKLASKNPKEPGLGEVGFDSDEAMDKSILLYTHVLRGIKEDDRTTEAFTSILINTRDQHNKPLKEDDIEFFFKTCRDEAAWKRFGNLFWSSCAIHYKIVCELGLLEDLDHVVFDKYGKISGVDKKYGHPRTTERHMVGAILGTLTIAYIDKHIEEYAETLGMQTHPGVMSIEDMEHSAVFVRVLMAVMSATLLCGGVLDFGKFLGFCSDNGITPDTGSDNLLHSYEAVFGVD